ncbi:hypothetical protein BS50DRAFT_169696 [Corynespora cassiicola Philippines]|uniref:Uncharacterized protein n=1 Tax=Corynespora cassiicola Philippines TaxID=1448308 RepID=A0A2T2P5B8_CORCC|nr:hypothetical protein BS50DRAFT_169696 [Corynespora cassiicola Philippines]
MRERGPHPIRCLWISGGGMRCTPDVRSLRSIIEIWGVDRFCGMGEKRAIHIVDVQNARNEKLARAYKFCGVAQTLSSLDGAAQNCYNDGGFFRPRPRSMGKAFCKAESSGRRDRRWMAVLSRGAGRGYLTLTAEATIKMHDFSLAWPFLRGSADVHSQPPVTGSQGKLKLGQSA